jgi:hypothetical protein
MSRHNKTLAERFHEKIIPVTESGCHIWIGSEARGGYGQIKIHGKKQLAHRVSYAMCNGEVPASLDVLHACDVPCCVNPDHLFLGSDSDNQKDSVRKGRAYFSNHPDRLQWKPRKLTVEQARAIALSRGPLSDTAKEFGISKCHVSSIRLRRVWANVSL